jgi:DMSO/TMAO reductase YedYZ molybdopterin-dependent catalytic subunit
MSTVPGKEEASAPGQDGARAGRPLEELVRRLGAAGLSAAPDAVADALWLARFVTPSPAGPADVQAQASPAHTRTDPRPVDPPPPVTASPGARQVGLHASTASGGVTAANSVHVPGGTTLPDTRPLRRALRPLRHYRPATRAAREPSVDEAATAERAAETGLLLPVLEDSARPAARLRILMDVSTSMAPWHQLLRELRRLCGRSGAFHDISVHYLHELPGAGTPVVANTRHPEAAAPASRLRDPTGQRITLVLSDCTGPLWRSGHMQRNLYNWAQVAPVAVLQPLPQRMWSRTHLPPVPGILRRPEHKARWDFRPVHTEPPAVSLHALAVPVLAPTAGAFGTWSRLLAGSTAAARGAAAWVLPHHLASRAPRVDAAVQDPAGLLRAFLAVASPDAVRLARYLATAPLVLPVMRLVQRVMLPHTGPSELAEVLLSGLLTRRPVESSDAENLAFDFHDGVRELLLDRVDRGEAALVLRELSDYVAQHFGRGTRNFPLLAATYLDGTVRPTGDAGQTGDEYAHPAAPMFAEVSSHVLRRFLPAVGGAADPTGASSAEPVRLREAEWFAHFRRADRHLHRYDEDGAVRDLEEAIRLLRLLGESTSDNMRSTWLNGLLSAALLRRWRALGMAEDLTEAVSTAFDGALRRDLNRPTVPGDFVTTGALGDALVALADEHDRAHDWLRLVPPQLLDVSPWQSGPSWAAYRLLTRAADAYGVVARYPEQEAYEEHTVRRAGALVLAAEAIARASADSAESASAEGSPEFVAVEYEGCLTSALSLLEEATGRDLGRRAEVVMKLARHFSGHGPVTRTERSDLAGRYAYQATTALSELLADQTRRLGPGHRDTLATRRRLARWKGWIEDGGIRPGEHPGSPVTRSSAGGDSADDGGEALPPGQRMVPGWPVRHYGPVPKFRPERWEFRVFGATASGDKHCWNFEEFAELPLTSVTADLHCVSRKSSTDHEWMGVAAATVLALAPPAPAVTHVMIWAEYGYSANLRLHDFASDRTLLARYHNGEALTPEHGFPLRLVVPHLYGWKSAKWVRGIEYMTQDRRGFWEERGYHNIGDPGREQRYSYQEEPGDGPIE